MAWRLLQSRPFDFVPITASWRADGTASHPFGEDHDPVARYRRNCLAVFHALQRARLGAYSACRGNVLERARFNELSDFGSVARAEAPRHLEKQRGAKGYWAQWLQRKLGRLAEDHQHEEQEHEQRRHREPSRRQQTQHAQQSGHAPSLPCLERAHFWSPSRDDCALKTRCERRRQCAACTYARYAQIEGGNISAAARRQSSTQPQTLPAACQPGIPTVPPREIGLRPECGSRGRAVGVGAVVNKRTAKGDRS